MAIKQIIKKSKRIFLSSASDVDSYVKYVLDRYSYEEKGKTEYETNVELKLSDCIRNITFYFSDNKVDHAKFRKLEKFMLEFFDEYRKTFEID